MLLIRRPSPDVSVEHPAALLRRDLLSCHGHIRRFTELAGRLARAREVAPAELASAASSLVDYFGRALPLHVLDEEESLAPRLAVLREDAVLARALAQMHAEHGPIEALLADALPRWRELAAVPEGHEALRAPLDEVARALDAAFTPHLAAEEQAIFPALVRLDDDALVGIRAEMRRRRFAPS